MELPATRALGFPPDQSLEVLLPLSALQSSGLGLLLLAFAAERFSFGLLWAVFVLYLTCCRGYSAASASSVMSAFVAVSYLTPVLGGALADRIGHRRASLAGAAAFSSGYWRTVKESPSLPGNPESRCSRAASSSPCFA